MTDIEQQERKEAEAEYPERGPEDFHTLAQWHRYHEWSVGARSGYAAALIHEHSKPSLMVGFSEEEIERMVLLADSEAFRRDDGELMMSGFGNGYFAGLRLANTRAVSIDRLVEVVDEWMQDRDGAGSIVYTDLRERLMKIMP